MRTERIVYLWDIDGTLIDSAGAGGAALEAAMRQAFALTHVRSVALHGRTDCGIIGDLLAAHGLDPTPETRELLCRTYLDCLPGHLAERSGRTLPGVQALLSELKGCQASVLGLLTGNMPHSAQAKLEHFQLWDYFAFGIFGDCVEHRPELSGPAVKRVAEHCGEKHPATQIIVIGDTPLDIALARQMGARSLAVCTGGFQADELWRAGADHVVTDLSDHESILAWCRANS